MLFLQGGRILDPYTGMQAVAHIFINDDGVIQDIGQRLQPPEGCPIYDATGRTITPGLVDSHVHFRDPGQTEKEDMFTGAAAAAAGGYTTVVCMANTVPTCDNVETLRYCLQRAAQIPTVQILQTCAITAQLGGTQLTDMQALLAAGAAGFTDDGVALANAGVSYQAMQCAKALGAVLSLHEEDSTLVPSAGVNFGSEAARKFGVQGALAASEEAMIARDIALALRTGARVVFQHVSTENAVRLIRNGKALGANIYAEVTPHHLALTQQDVCQHGTNARMNPPLRTEEDRQGLIMGLMDGTLDMIATDHAPHKAEEKARDFAQAPSGIIGLETAFSVANTTLVRTGCLSEMGLVAAMSCTPAQIYGLKNKAITVGNRAALAVLDFTAEITYHSYVSKASNSPFTNLPLVGAPCATVMGDLLTQSVHAPKMQAHKHD